MPEVTPLATKHQVLFGSEPTPLQRRIYDAFPQYRGISSSEQNPEVMQAIILLALTFGHFSERVYVFAPPMYEAWVLEQFSRAADQILTVCRNNPNSGALARGYGKLFHKVAFTGKVLQFQQDPEKWLACGFAVSDPIPEWMSKALLVTEEAEWKPPQLSV